jgi:hypothetical protein
MNKRGCAKLIGLCALIVFAVLQFTGCTVANPQTRVQQNPALFDQLSATDRDLVMKGTISEGMTKDAVFLAWGRPDAVSTGSDRGKVTETWRYATMRPVYGAGFGYGMGYYGGRGYYGGGYYGRRYYPGWDVGFTPQYVPVTSSVVRFRGGRVVAWEASDR